MRFNFARLSGRQQDPKDYHLRVIPILEPYLDLARAEAWNLLCEPFPMRCIGVRLAGKFTHQESSLIVS